MENSLQRLAADVIERSVQRIPLYQKMDTVKIDASNMTSKNTKLS